MNYEEQELLKLCGTDPRALKILSDCYDAALDDNVTVDVEALLVHCAPGTDPEVLTDIFPELILQWLKAVDEAAPDEDGLYEQIGQELYWLRHGEYPCRQCPSWNVTNMRPRLPGRIDCARCRDQHDARMSRPVLRVVA